MRGRVAALVAAASLTGAAPPSMPPVLDHDGPWDVHLSENACLLGRTFGKDKQQVTVAFQPLFHGLSGEIFIGGPAGGGERRGEATIIQEPSGRVIKGEYFSRVPPKSPTRTTRITVPLAAWEGLSDTDVLRIKAPPVDVRLKLVRFLAAKRVFDECERQMLKAWDVDPAALEPGRAPTPIKSPTWYFTSDDYPIKAMQAGHVGRVVAVISVDAAGAVTGCRIGSSSWPDLNEVTCREGRRVKFAPAHDSGGRPIASIFLLPVRWML